MTIKKSKIRSYDRYFGFLNEGDSFRLIARVSGVDQATVSKMGFPERMKLGMKMLPAPAFGNISLFNAEGKNIKRTDLPMETAYRTVEWHWEEWNGPYDTIERSRFVDVPYERYPREFMEPPSEEIEVMRMGDELVFASRVLINKAKNQEENLHVANFFLEIFGEAEVVSRDLESFYSPKQKGLNWEVLPPGEYPWEKIKKRLEAIVDVLPKGNQPWVRHRIETVRSYKPDFHAMGTGGFYGYIVYGFSKLGLFVLECVRYGNATYVFKKDWKVLSQLTKAEVLRSGADVKRIIHHKSWTKKVKELLSGDREEEV